MKALSIRSPWWWAILKMGKDIENRDWWTGYRGRVLIHASKWWKQDEVEDDFDHAIAGLEMQRNECLSVGLTEPEVENDLFRRMRSLGGHIVGSVEIVDCIRESKSPWFCGKYGFVLRNPVTFDKPWPVKGALGLFEVEP